MKKITCKVQTDEATKLVGEAFDYEFDGISSFECWDKPKLPEDFNIGLIVGPSGSGKSILSKEFGTELIYRWDKTKAIVSQFETPEDAIDKLSAVGLNSIPSWCKPYHVLSTGEKFRADLSQKLYDGSVIDEFTSVVDRNVAKASSVAVSKYIRKKDLKNIVFVSCHEDIIEWLCPDWVFDTTEGKYYSGRSLHRPKINIKIYKTTYNTWKIFKKHHYLSAKLNKASKCFVAYWDDKLIGFSSVLPLPSGTLKNAWRAHRTVILPDFQGMGFGTLLSDNIGQMFVNEGKRFYSRTAHIRFGEHREQSDNWRPTATNKKRRKGERAGNTNFTEWEIDMKRVCYAHEYIGKKEEGKDGLIFEKQQSLDIFD